MLLTLSSVTALSPSAITAHATALRDRGFTVVNQPIADATLLSRAAAEVVGTLDTLLEQVADAGFHPLEQQYLFDEICYRQYGRWDVRRPYDTADTPAWAELCSKVKAATVVPILAELQLGEPETLMSGAIVSRAGARAQRPHADADLEQYEAGEADETFRTFSCFIPLVDLHGSSGDGTQFWPGSHVSAATAEAAWERATRDGWEQRLARRPVGSEAPICRAGGLVLYDSRIIHAGLPSQGRTRPIAYLVIGTGGAQDSNFDYGRIAHGGVTPESYPFWRELESCLGPSAGTTQQRRRKLRFRRR
tara:strand:+ start:37 stop:954 length:918 start_codon:yes stop_codon:yes gene_type:complete